MDESPADYQMCAEKKHNRQWMQLHFSVYKPEAAAAMLMIKIARRHYPPKAQLKYKS